MTIEDKDLRRMVNGTWIPPGVKKYVPIDVTASPVTRGAYVELLKHHELETKAVFDTIKELAIELEKAREQGFGGENKPPITEALAALREASGGAFDGVDPVEYVRELRDKGSESAQEMSLPQFIKLMANTLPAIYRNSFVVSYNFALFSVSLPDAKKRVREAINELPDDLRHEVEKMVKRVRAVERP